MLRETISISTLCRFSTGDDDITVLGSNDNSQSPVGQGNSKDTKDETKNDNSGESYCLTDINAAEFDTFEELPSTQASTGTTYIPSNQQYIHTIIHTHSK